MAEPSDTAPAATSQGSGGDSTAQRDPGTDSASRQLRMILDCVEDAVLRMAPDGTVSWASPSLENLLGWAPADALGIDFADLLSPDRSARAPLDRALAEQLDSVRYRVLAAHRDGSLRWVEVRARLPREASGELASIVATLRDVTEEVSSQAAAQTANSRLYASLNAQLDPHALLRALRDDAGAVVDFHVADLNGRVSELLDRERLEVLGRRVSTLVDSPELIGLLAGGLEVGQFAANSQAIGIPGRAVRYFDVRGIRVGPDELSVTAQDVTQRHEDALQLERSRAYYRALMTALGTGILVFSAEGRIVESNATAARILGLTADQIAGRTVADPTWRAVRGDGTPLGPEQYPAAITMRTGNAVRDLVMGLHRPDGALVWLLVNSEPVPGDSPTSGGTVVSFNDITEQVTAQRELAAGREQLALVTDNVSDVVLRYTGDGTLVWASPSLRSIFGWEPDDVVGRPFTLAKDPVSTAAEFAAALTRRDTTASQRFPAVCADGTEREAESRVRFMWRADGSLDQIVASVRDVTEQAAVECALAASEARLRASVNALADPFAVIGPGLPVQGQPGRLRFTVANSAALILFGGTATDGDVRGARLANAFSPAVEASLLDWYATPEQRARPWRRRADATEVAAGEGTYDLTAVAFGDEVVLTAHDVSDSLAVAEALRESRARYKALADNASDVVLEVDGAGRIVWVSESARAGLGWDIIATIGSRARDLVHPDDTSLLDAVLDAVPSATPQASPTALRLRQADGSYRWMSAAARAVAEDGSTAATQVLGLSDVEELVAARQEALAGRATLQAILDSELDPRAMLAAVRAADGQIVDLMVTDANPAMLAAVGRRRELLVGKPMSRCLPLEPSRMLQACIGVMLTGVPLVLDGAHMSAADPANERWFDFRAVAVGEQVSLTWRDVTERHQHQARLAASEERYRMLAENASDVVFRTDQRAHIEWVSPSVRELLGFSPEDLIGSSLVHRVHPGDLPDLQEALAARAGGQFALEVRFRTSTGGFKWLALSARWVLGADGTVAGLVGSARDITAARQAREDLEFMANHDFMTRLANRANVLSRLSGLLSHKSRAGTSTAVLFADMDHLKQINDSLGHAAGDAAIIEVANRLLASVREQDTVARIGGDEFLVLLPGIGSAKDAQAIVSKIRTALEPAALHDGTPIQLSLSIGVTIARIGEGPDEVLERADSAAYEDKLRKRPGPAPQ